MSKPESDAPIRLATASVVKALFVQSVKTKEETSTIAGKFGERVKAQVENGNLHNAAFSQAAAIFRKARNNELKAKEHIAHLRHYIEIIEEDLYQKGHTGNLVDQAQQEPPAAPTAASAAAEAFAKEDAEVEAGRAEARKALDLEADGSSAAPPPPEAVEEKPKRGRKAKTAEAVEAAPPPPPVLKDDEDEFEAAAPARRARAPGTATAVH